MKTKVLTFKNILSAICVCGLAVITAVTSMMIAGLNTSEASISFEGSGSDTANANYGRYFVGGANNGLSQTGGGGAIW